MIEKSIRPALLRPKPTAASIASSSSMLVVATLLLQISGFAASAGAQTAQTAAAPKREWWYLGVLRYVMPLAIALDAVGSKQCISVRRHAGHGDPGESARLTPHK
jgi:hypothetical protein